jgi:hypothetical protein
MSASLLQCQQCGEETSGFTQEDVDDGEAILCVECKADPLYQWTGDFEFPRQRAERLTTDAEALRELKEDR